MFSILLAVLVLTASPDPTKGWVKKSLSSLGKQKFSFEASLKVPAGTKTSGGATTDGEGKRTGTMAYLDLPDGVRVILMERSANAVTTDAKMLDMMESRVAMNGKMLVSTREPTFYLFMAQASDGIVFQAANWAVAPGIDCATMKPVTRAQADQVIAICKTLAK